MGLSQRTQTTHVFGFAEKTAFFGFGVDTRTPPRGFHKNVLNEKHCSWLAWFS